MPFIDHSHTIAEATFTEFGAVGPLIAAEIVDADGRVFAIVAEPLMRSERDDWTDSFEREFREAVRTWAVEEVGPDSQYNGALPVYLVFDPARSRVEEEVIRE